VASISNPLDLTTKLVKASPSGGAETRGASLKDGVVAVVGAATEDNECLRMTYSSDSKLSGAGLRTDVTLPGGHSLIVDEPTTMPGGTNAGPNPLDLFCAAFGTCQEITYKYYADVLGIDCQSVACKVEAPIDLGGLVGVAPDAVGLTNMSATITIESDASEEALAQLKGAVDAHCPLVDSISKATPVSLAWKRAGGK
jgi:uncharacterized OsmC-like protein